jgi:hypothetical protein
LPLLYEIINDGVTFSRVEWEWAQDLGMRYPVSYRSMSRTIYPNNAVEVTTSEVRFTEVIFPSRLADSEFGFAALGLKPGTIVYDMRDPAQPRYEFQPNSGAVDGLVKLSPPPGATPVPSDRTRHWGVWIVLANLMAGLFLAGLYLRSKLARRANP